jgi:Leucine-rich repeat (LRR) protein
MFESCPVSTLSLANDQIQEIEVGAFENCKNLKVLSLNRNLCENLSADIFLGLENLRELDIAEQQSGLSEYPLDLLQHIPNLTTLRMGSENLQKIPNGFFTHTPDLSSITLEDSPLEQTTKGAFRAVELPTGLPKSFGVEEPIDGNWGM